MYVTGYFSYYMNSTIKWFIHICLCICAYYFAKYTLLFNANNTWKKWKYSTSKMYVTEMFVTEMYMYADIFTKLTLKSNTGSHEFKARLHLADSHFEVGQAL